MKKVFMEAKDYVAPQIDVVEVMVEKGFAESDPNDTGIVEGGGGDGDM